MSLQILNDRSVGILLVLTVSLIWILASYLVQYLEDHTVSPFLITYICNTLFLIFLPLVWIQRRFLTRYGLFRRQGYDTVASEEASQEGAENAGLTDKDTFILAAKIAPLWWLAQFTFNVSLDLTSVSSNTILSSTSSLFTFGLSWFFLNESFFVYKLVSLLICFGGIVLTVFSDNEEEEDGERPIWGDLICVMSALFYGGYTVLLKRQIPSTSQIDMGLLFGFMGLILFIGVSLLAVFLTLFGWVDLHLSPITGVMVCVKGLLDNVLSDFLWAKAVVLIGPTIATVGLSMQWPIALVIDILFRHPAWMDNVSSILLISFGSVLILIGFVGINIPEIQGADLEDRFRALVGWKPTNNANQSLSKTHELNEK